jgi:hypothetical protein
MLGVLSFTYSSMLQSVEHEALSTAIPKVQQLLKPLMSSGVFKFFNFHLVLSASILTKIIFYVVISNIGKFLVRAIMNDSNLHGFELRILNLEARMSNFMQASSDELAEIKSGIRIEFQALLDENECLSSRVDPFSASGDSLADWICR